MTCRRSQVRVLYRAPRVCDILDVTDSFFVVSPRTGKADVASGHGRIWNPPLRFFAAAEPPRRGRCPAWSFLPLSKTRSVGAHSICARGSLPCRKRARADMESAPTFFVAGGVPPQRAVPRVEFSPFVESEIRRGAFYMRPRRFILPQAGTGGYGLRPYVFCGGRSPLAEAVPRVEFSPFVESEIRRGAFYMRPRRFILPQAGTGGYGIRPYVFLWRAESPRRGGATRGVVSPC